MMIAVHPDTCALYWVGAGRNESRDCRCGANKMGCIDISGINVERNEDKILVSMLNPAEPVVRRWPEAATCLIDCASRLEPTADKNATAVSNASWRTFTSPLQYETGSLFQKTNAP